MSATVDNAGLIVDNPSDSVHKSTAGPSPELDTSGNQHQPAEKASATSPVDSGASGASLPPDKRPRVSTGSTRSADIPNVPGPFEEPKPDSKSPSDLPPAYERLGRLNATSEREIIEGYGTCGRCGGTGSITYDVGRYVSCPRCGGTGRKPDR